ncbi:hypothetical protein MMC27_007212 [Xylographa pallens]|nr:hypothetical protein [Xylographa pallens]
MAQQRIATVYLFYVLAILFYWHEITQALALPAVASLEAKSPGIASISSSHKVTSASVVISNGNITSPTRQLTQRTPPSKQRKIPSPLYTSSQVVKFARAQTVTSIIRVDLISTPGAATRTQPSSRFYATSTLIPSRTSSSPYPTTFRTVSIHPSITTASTLSSTATLSRTPSSAPPSPSASSLTTALLPQPLSLSLLIPLILILAIIVILLSLLIRSSRPTLTPTQRQPRSENIHTSTLLEVPSTESTVVTCREIYELPSSAPWGDRERSREGTKELDAGWWVVEMG